jgi:hypothetical protein
MPLIGNRQFANVNQSEQTNIGDTLMKTKIIAAALAVALIAPAEARAWGRCDPQAAEELYVCTALLNCAKLGVTYQQLAEMTEPQAKDRAEKFIAQNGNYAIWEQLKMQGQNQTAAIPAIKEQQIQVMTHMLLGAVDVITHIQTAPINDYQCKANIAFNELALKGFAISIAALRFFDNPLSNWGWLAAMNPNITKEQKDSKIFEATLELQATQAAQCYNRNPIYTEGLAFEAHDVNSC